MSLTKEEMDSLKTRALEIGLDREIDTKLFNISSFASRTAQKENADIVSAICRLSVMLRG